MGNMTFNFRSRLLERLRERDPLYTLMDNLLLRFRVLTRINMLVPKSGLPAENCHGRQKAEIDLLVEMGVPRRTALVVLGHGRGGRQDAPQSAIPQQLATVAFKLECRSQDLLPRDCEMIALLWLTIVEAHNIDASVRKRLGTAQWPGNITTPKITANTYGALLAAIRSTDERTRQDALWLGLKAASDPSCLDETIALKNILSVPTRSSNPVDDELHLLELFGVFETAATRLSCDICVA